MLKSEETKLKSHETKMLASMLEVTGLMIN